MLRSIRILIAISIAAFGFAGYAPAAPATSSSSVATVAGQTKQAFVEALAPSRSGRPTIAILALNEGTEMTDLMLPHAVLKRADIANVHIVAARGGRVSLYPALQIMVHHDLADFDRRYPSGADYVIVPAMEPDNDPAVTAWLRAQAEKGARIIAVCSGARVAGQAGLLDGRRFTGHWYDRDTLLKRHPGAVHVPDQRYVIDRGVATSTGITASLPTVLALAEAIGGQEKARTLANELGVRSWSPEHDSSGFGLTFSRAANYVLNKAAFWRDENWSVPVQEGTDDIALALIIDAWSRTGHVNVQATSPSKSVKLRSGLELMTRPSADTDLPRLPFSPGLKPMQQLNRTLCEIARHYGPSRREWVMQEMEYAGVLTASRAEDTAQTPDMTC